MSEPMSFRKNLPPKFEKIKYGKFGPKDLDYPIQLHLKENDVTVQESGSEIVQFLKGKHVLITGGTGFLGKMLVEKLLRCCEEIKLYLIIRDKKGKQTKDRVDEMLNSYVFHKVRKIHPNFRENVVGISGDISQPKLGLSNESQEFLKEKINIIYHLAATIRFDEQLRKAVHANILGTEEVIKLAKECKHLDVFTHVSTAYSNSHLTKIDEIYYEPVVPSDKLIMLINEFSDDVLDKITPGLLGGLPNTYTLTKQSTEYMIKNTTQEIPACICRPSIILSTSKEPFRGWSDNPFGAIGFMLAVALGICHVQKGNARNRADLIPADYVVNHCISASYKTFLDRDTGRTVIYNCTSGKYSLEWGSMDTLVKPFAAGFASTKSIMPIFIVFSRNKIIIWALKTLCHKVPAYILDFVAVWTGRKPQLQKIYDKIDKLGEALSFFSTNKFDFDDTNTQALWTSLNEVDKQNFNFNIRTLNWTDYFAVLMAVREYIFHEFLDSLDQDRAQYKRMKRVFALVVLLVTFLPFLFVYVLFKFCSILFF